MSKNLRTTRPKNGQGVSLLGLNSLRRDILVEKLTAIKSVLDMLEDDLPINSAIRYLDLDRVRDDLDDVARSPQTGLEEED